MKRKIIFIIYIICIFTFFFNTVYAGLEEIYAPLNGTGGDAQKLYNAAGIIVGALKWGGIMICAGMLIYKGIQLMIVSPDGKAQIKKELSLWAIGTVILFTFTSLIQMIQELVTNAGLNTVS